MKIFFSSDQFEIFEKELRSWINTPYWRNEGIKGRGADCSLFIACVLKEIGILERIIKPEYLPKDWQTHGTEDLFFENFQAHKKFLRPGLIVEEVVQPFQPGDWLLFSTSIRRLLNHSAIYLGNNEIIHSIESKGVVIENLSKWQKHLRKVYRLFEV